MSIDPRQAPGCPRIPVVLLTALTLAAAVPTESAPGQSGAEPGGVGATRVASGDAGEATVIAHSALGAVTRSEVREAANALDWPVPVRDEERAAQRVLLLRSAELEPPDDEFAASWQAQRVASCAAQARRWLRRPASEDELQAQWRQHRDALGRPERVRLRQVFIALDPGASEATAAGAGPETARSVATRTAEQLVERLERGEAFEDLAREHSSSTSAVRGGLVGWVPTHRLADPVREVVRQLVDGQTSIVQLPGGVAIVQRLAWQEPVPAAFESSLQRLERLARREREDRLRRWIGSGEVVADESTWRLEIAAVEPVLRPPGERAPAVSEGRWRLTLPSAVAAWLAAVEKGGQGEQVASAAGRARSDAALALLARRGGLCARLDDPEWTRWQRREVLHRQRVERRLAAATEPRLVATAAELEEFFARHRGQLGVDLAALELEALVLDLGASPPRRLVESFSELPERLGRNAAAEVWEQVATELAGSAPIERIELGWRTERSGFALGPSYDPLFEALPEPGFVSHVLQEGERLHVVRVRDRRLAGEASLRRPEIERLVRSMVERRKRSVAAAEVESGILDGLAFEAVAPGAPNAAGGRIE